MSQKLLLLFLYSGNIISHALGLFALAYGIFRGYYVIGNSLNYVIPWPIAICGISMLLLCISLLNLGGLQCDNKASLKLYLLGAVTLLFTCSAFAVYVHYAFNKLLYSIGSVGVVVLQLVQILFYMREIKDVKSNYRPLSSSSIVSAAASIMRPAANATDERSLLSDRAILRHMQQGTIIIEPFCRANLATCSYDVTLGEYFFREQRLEHGVSSIYNPYSEQMVSRIWGKPHKAELASEWSNRTGIALENIFENDRIIWLAPGETILAHTEEFIGGRKNVTTMMKARSSWGRNFLEVCKCAGWGDVGFFNRWTLEITSNSQHYSIPLVVGRRIGQIVFFECEDILGDSYEKDGKYQSGSDVGKLRDSWRPESMLPQMFRDREVVAATRKKKA